MLKEANPIWSQFVRSLGRGAATTGRAGLSGLQTAGNVGLQGLRAGGSGLRTLATNPVTRPIATGAAGVLAGNAAGNQIASIDPDNPALATVPSALQIVGGMAGASAGSPWVRNQLRYAARVPEGGSFTSRPIRHSLNLMSAPRFPVIEPILANSRHAALRWAPTAARVLPYAAGGAGLAMGAHGAVEDIREQMVENARRMGITDENTLDKIRQRSLGPAASSLWRSVAPFEFMGRDTTPVGDLHRSLLQNYTLPEQRHALHLGTEQNPIRHALMRWPRNITPMGNIQNSLMRNLATPEEPNSNANMASVLEENREGLTNPEVLNSPILRSYTELLTHPSIVNDPNVQNVLGRLGQNLYAQNRQPITQAVRTSVNSNPDIPPHVRWGLGNLPLPNLTSQQIGQAVPPAADVLRSGIGAENQGTFSGNLLRSIYSKPDVQQHIRHTIDNTITNLNEQAYGPR